MKLIDWPWLKGLSGLIETRRPEPVQQAGRVAAMQLHIVLPAKAVVIAVALHSLLSSGWLAGVTSTRGVVLELLQKYFFIYILCNIIAGVMFLLWRRFPPGLFQWLAFTLGLLDGLFMAGLTFITGGFESMVYWLFGGSIVLNAISIPLATPQLVLNLLLSAFYFSAGILDANIPYQFTLESVPKRNPSRASTGTLSTNPSVYLTNAAAPTELPDASRRAHKRVFWDASEPTAPLEATPAEPVLLRLSVLLLLAACCYGVQVLAERQRRVSEEQREFAVREVQLRSVGRLAAEFAHQIKNPLAIINNAVFSMQRALKEGRNDVASQIKIIREEVERSDKIVTQIMGYAQLSEGHVEKLDVREELDRAIGQALPPGAGYGIRVERHYDTYFPPLLMQRRHLNEILVNLLQNAREALNGAGTIAITAAWNPDDSIEIRIADDGPGIQPDKLERVFEAYYTTKEKGTGLGLAIAKHNVELYAGTVRAESGLGKGAQIVIVLPARTVVSLAKPS